MKNPVGVAEHPDTMATIEEELGKIADFRQVTSSEWNSV